MTKKSKKALAAIFAALCVCPTAYADQNPLDNVTISEVPVTFTDAVPYFDTADASVMLPIRAIAEAMGCTVEWDAETEQVTVTSETSVLTYHDDAIIVYVNGEEKHLRKPVVEINDRTYMEYRDLIPSIDRGYVGYWRFPSNELYIYEGTSFSETDDGIVDWTGHLLTEEEFYEIEEEFPPDYFKQLEEKYYGDNIQNN